MEKNFLNIGFVLNESTNWGNRGLKYQGIN